MYIHSDSIEAKENDLVKNDRVSVISILTALHFFFFRKLADISRDNLLDVSEFATAMHLIQQRLRGSEIPEKLPTSLTPVRATLTIVTPMSTEEWNAYNKTFVWKDANNSGFLDSMYIQSYYYN